MKKVAFDFERFSKEVQKGLREEKPMPGQGGLFISLKKKILEVELE